MPKVVDHDKRREEILDHCFRLFAEQGYVGMSMRNIARSLGVSTGTLYYYFDSKEAIFEAIIQRLSARDIADVVSQIPDTASRRARSGVLKQFLSENASVLEDAMQLALEYRRQQGGTLKPELLNETLGVYRRTLHTLLSMPSNESSTVVLSIILGGLFQSLLEPGVMDWDAHILAVNQLTGIDDGER